MKIIIDRVPRIILLTSIVLLATILALQDLYITRILKEMRQNSADLQNAVNECREELDSCMDTSGQPHDFIYTGKVVEYVGKIPLEDKSGIYRVFFSYPEQYTVIINYVNGKKVISVYHDAMINNKKQFTRLLTISGVPNYMVTNPETAAKETAYDRMVTVNNKQYKFDFFDMNAIASNGNKITAGNYVAMLDKDLWVSVDAEVGVTQDDINASFKIVESITWEVLAE